MENKKTKLTISGTAKKSIKNIEIAKHKSKETVIIDKNKNKSFKKAVLSNLQILDLDLNHLHN